MQFKKLHYIDWARQNIDGNFKYNLGNSCMTYLTKEDLGLGLNDIELYGGKSGISEVLKSKIAKMYGVDEQNILITTGATMSLFLLCSVLLESRDDVILEAPNYEPLYKTVLHFTSTVKIIERRFDKGFQLDLEELERKISRNAKAIIITNVHNPSGVSTSPEKLSTIGQIARDYKTMVISDEVYLDGVLNPQLKPAVTLGQNMISINSMTKIFGLPQIKIGWIAADEGIIKRLNAAYLYITGGSVSYPSQMIALKALQNADSILSRYKDVVSRNIKVISDWINSRDDVEWDEPEGGTTCFIRIPSGVDDVRIADLLMQKYNTLIVPGNFFWARGFIRISFGCNTETLQVGLSNIGKALDEVKKKSF